jgi:hypothetical protein
MTDDQAIEPTKPTARPPDPSLDTIRTLGRLLDDLERVRIMNSNRIGALERAFGESLPHLAAISEPLEHAEHLAELELVRAWRKHPLAPWAKGQRGVGEKSIARLIAEIGDPLIGSVGHWETSNGQRTDETQQSYADDPGDHGTHDIHNGDVADTENGANPSAPPMSSAPRSRTWVIDSYYERTVSQLWQFSGVGDPARSKIPKGAVQADLMARGKPRAKKQLWLIAGSMLKAGNRDVYDARRLVTAERVHLKPCPQCHAKTGEPWKPGHQHADALRIVAKRFLQDMFVAAIGPTKPILDSPRED